MNRGMILLLALVVVIVGVFSSTFRVGEWEQAIVIQLGKPVRTVTDPGLNFKKPFVQDVRKFDKRLLEYDADPRELITNDKQQVVVDNFSRWKIADPLLYYQSVRNAEGAQRVLDDIIYSVIREHIGQMTLSELVSGDRSAFLSVVAAQCREKGVEYGIDIVDVRIKRADLPEKNEQNVFARMRTERERQAKKFRAEGEEEAQKIRSMAEREARIIVAEAKRESEIIRGEGDAKSARIYATAYGLDPQFYSFVRSLESYRKAFEDGATILLTPENEFLKTFKRGQ